MHTNRPWYVGGRRNIHNTGKNNIKTWFFIANRNFGLVSITTRYFAVGKGTNGMIANGNSRRIIKSRARNEDTFLLPSEMNMCSIFLPKYCVDLSIVLIRTSCK